MADYMELVKNSRLRETMIDRCEQELNHKETGREMRFVGCDVSKPKTNADRIRAMTDEELADMRVRYNPVTEMYINDTDEAYYDFVSAMEAELEWLQQPAEGE